MTYTKKLTAALALAVAVAFGGVAHADLFTGDGDGFSWEDPDNWLLNAVPLNNGSGNTFINAHDVEFDANTFASLVAASNTQSNTQYRVVRFLLNESTSGPIGTGSLTFDHGNANEVLQTNGNSAVFGSRTGQTTVNLLSGTVNTGSNTTFGARDGIGILNLSDGQFIVGRGNLTLGNATGSGTGFIDATGGTLLTRGGAIINSDSVFEVVGTGATVGIGSQGSVDGFWTQEANAILRPGLDGTGVSTILIDDVGGGGGAATFAVGSILDPFDNGGFFTNIWEDVLFAEGGITDNGLTLSSVAAGAGFEQRIINGNTLQVRLVDASVVPEPSSLALLGLGGLFLAGRRRRS